jgi:hypothetical protein
MNDTVLVCKAAVVPSRERLTREQVGAWIVKSNPDETWPYFAASQGQRRDTRFQRAWTLGETYREELIRTAFRSGHVGAQVHRD